MDSEKVRERAKIEPLNLSLRVCAAGVQVEPIHAPGALPPLATFRLLFEGPAPGVGAAPFWFWHLPKATLPPPTAQLEEPPAAPISLASGPSDLSFTVTALPSVDFAASFASPTVYGYQQTCVSRCSKQ